MTSMPSKESIRLSPQTDGLLHLYLRATLQDASCSYVQSEVLQSAIGLLSTVSLDILQLLAAGEACTNGIAARCLVQRAACGLTMARVACICQSAWRQPPQQVAAK